MGKGRAAFKILTNKGKYLWKAYVVSEGTILEWLFKYFFQCDKVYELISGRGLLVCLSLRGIKPTFSITHGVI